jgi:indolepyruvate ferredoxin oxidoreductase
MTQPVAADASERAGVALDDKYTLARGRAYMTAVQALVRLPMLQRERDRREGRNTAGFVSGYRGSPLGGVDLAFWQAAKHLEPHDVHFQPGINEDLAATAVWGSQQVHLNPARVDGVFAMWYGKAPGVDRSVDAIRHANAAGTSPAGGVLAVFGDDHGAKSSTLPSQSEQVMAACMIPVLYPANVQEYLDFGLHGWALSRYSGLWVGFKCVTDVVESSASVEIDPSRVQPRVPTDFAMPAEGLGLRWPDTPAQQEARLVDHRLAAAQAYVRANGLDRVVVDSKLARLGIICAGKAYLDVREALDLLGIGDATAQRLGIRVYKLGMTWPVEPTGLRAFAQGLDEVLVVEEKRAFIETQVKEILYDLPDARPRVVGKFEPGPGLQPACREWLLDTKLELTPARIALVVLARLENILGTGEAAALRQRLAPAHAQVQAAGGALLDQRIPYFCSGCPHNTSTVVPEGSRAIAGIGCHGMVTWMDRKTTTWTHMGGEGVVWIGQARFSKDKHVFANLGDGTYFHSGLLAIRAAVSAQVSITYKILFNDAVAMTGGQPFDGPLDVPTITRQVAAEGVRRVVIVTDEPDKYVGAPKAGFAPGVDVYHRDKLDAVQRELRKFEGVSVLVYDQTCAAEKRRRRKRGEFPDPPRRVVINDLVCEGCGDCSVQSNCLSIEPLETPLGTKRTINQSSCNKDFSCVKGFCPSFITVEGGRLRKPAPVAAAGSDPAMGLPAPHVATLVHGAHETLITGVGGTGVVTASALLGMAAHIEGKGVSVMDMTGTAQKGGAVMSHVRIAAAPAGLHGARVRTADLLIGGDLIVSASAAVLGCLQPGRSRVVLNTASAPTAALVRNPDWRFPGAQAQRALQALLGDAEPLQCIDARALAVALLGDAIYANPLMLGFALQKGWLPVGLQAVERAIELNGAAFLTDYQDTAYAARYRGIVGTAAHAELRAGGGTALARTVAVQAFRLMAYKDEYEVARLHTDGSLRRQLAGQFEGDYSLRFHLAPPALSRPPAEGAPPAKRVFGAWMEPAMRLLARCKFLRGSAFDPFGYTQERRTERELVGEYELLVEQVVTGLTPARLPAAIELAGWTALVRGYGHVKVASLQAGRARQKELLLRWDATGQAPARVDQAEAAPAA